MDLFGHFTRNSWKFHNDNCIKVLDALGRSGLKSNFQFDVRQINWRSYCASFVEGNRRFLLKETDSTLPKARRKLQT